MNIFTEYSRPGAISQSLQHCSPYITCMYKYQDVTSSGDSEGLGHVVD